MNQTKTLFSRISNNILLLFTITILSFIWINYNIRNLKISLLSSIIILIFFCIIYYPIRIFLNKKSLSQSLSDNKLNQLKSELLFGKYIDNIKFISSLFGFQLTPTENNAHFTFNNQDIFFKFDKELLTDEDLTKLIKLRKNNQITIYCINANTSINLESIEINIVNINHISQKINTNSIEIPNTIITKKTPKFRLKDYFCIIFSRARTKGYFGFGLLLIISSLFTPYHTYYIVTGTILLLLALYSRFNKRFNIN